MTEIILSILAGLVLFLFAVTSLSDTIQQAVGDDAQRWITRFTSHVFSAILTGIVVTTLLDSSSAVIILTIILVNSNVLSFRQAMGIVLGANIGTTISSQIIAMDVGKYSPVFLLIGFALILLSKSPRFNNTGRIILYFGILFFGLFTMEKAVEPLKEYEAFFEMMQQVEHPLYGALAGAVVTLIVQSSSATVGMAIILAKKGLLALGGGIAVMLGAELGTCSDTLLATIRGNRQALKTGLFHLIFNFLSIVVGLLSFYPFVKLVQAISQGAPIERMVANAHLLFNIGGVLVFVWFLPLFERGLNRLLPDSTH
jgi:phosphate:Na+ symporter